MTREEIEGALGGNPLMRSRITMRAIGDLMHYATPRLLMDKDSLDYYYEVDVDELASSSMPKETLEDLRNDGWSLSEDKARILVYLK